MWFPRITIALIPLKHYGMPNDKIELEDQLFSENFDFNVEYSVFYEYIFFDNGIFLSTSHDTFIETNS